MEIVGGPLRVVVSRWGGYLGLWIMLIGLDPLDLVVGVFTATAATWASLRLLPPAKNSVRFSALPRLALGMLWQSVSAGIDVALRAFAPNLPLRPGFVPYPTQYPRGPGRNAFASLSSLLPGTLAARDDDQGLLYHCLDVERPIAAELAGNEATVSRAIPR